jgi:succinate-semialdehyde dehydrogenase/glutarate-semialdehyde dehydrogenase
VTLPSPDLTREHTWFDSVDPATGRVLASFAALERHQVDDKLALAVSAFATQRASSLTSRAALLQQVAQTLRAESEACARLIARETGKVLRTAHEEVEKCAVGCEHFARHAAAALADEHVDTPGARTFVRYEPLGVILVVTTWNYPFWQVFRSIAPALMAGNVCLVKHAPNVPQCALAIEALFARAGAAAGLVQTLLVDVDTVDRLLRHPQVAAVTMTGRVGTGRRIGAACGHAIKKAVLELGGSDPLIVMPSANLDRAVDAAVEAVITNAGQSCTAGRRVILAEPIAHAFERAFTGRMERVRVGDPLEDGSEMGPLGTAEVLARLDVQVRQSIAAGCRLLAGGGRLRRSGNYFAPTVLADIPKAAPAYSDEVFGPVACLFRVPGVTEAIALANDVCYGLGASVWTSNPEEQQRFVAELDAGMVFVNRRVRSDPRLPWGGVKQSGYGRELGVIGLRELTRVKTVWLEGSHSDGD